MTDAVIEAMARAIHSLDEEDRVRAPGPYRGEPSSFSSDRVYDSEREKYRTRARAAYLAGQNAMRAAIAAEVREECARVADAVAENMRSLCAHYRAGGMPQFATESLLQQRTAEAIAATIRAG